MNGRRMYRAPIFLLGRRLIGGGNAHFSTFFSGFFAHSPARILRSRGAGFFPFELCSIRSKRASAATNGGDGSDISKGTPAASGSEDTVQMAR